MKAYDTLKILILFSLFYTVQSYCQDNLPTLQGPYLGQKPPGTVPEPFAPGIITTERWEYGVTFSPAMDELYLLQDGADEKTSFLVFQNKQGQWHKSVISPRVGQPFIAPDGKTLHLGRRYMKRNGDTWSDIKKLGPAFQELRIMRLTASSKGTYVFDEVGSKDGDGRIRYARFLEGKREKPKVFGEEINTGTFNAHPFIAPDESYIIWDGRRNSGYGHSDLYISFRQQDGSWGAAINLGPNINTPAWEASASVTPDGKYLFFNRTVSPGNVDIFWVDAKVVWALKPKS